jgi:hypothetical protein
VTEYLGATERRLARALVARLPGSTPALTWTGIDLRSSAEHLLYGALRQPMVPAIDEPYGAARPLARIGREATRGVRPRARRGGGVIDLAVFVTQPVHASLFAPIAEHLPPGVAVRLVDARTHAGPSRPIPGASERIADHIDLTLVSSLVPHTLAVRRRLSAAPDAWRELVDASRAARLASILRRGLPLVALDTARVATFIARRRPAVIACFSESGLLARIVPAVATARSPDVAVVDLPHAEAADPWGTAGAAYDGVAVYGPRAAAVMQLAGIATERVVQIGPLRYDGLISRAGSAPLLDSPRRVVLASQPGDPAKRAVHPDVKRAVIRAAIAIGAELRPAEVRIVPHPTETDRITEEVLADAEMPPGVEIRVDHAGSLHDVLAGAWLVITGASQSVFDAVLSGVPAITLNPTGGEDPVTFARDGIALGARSVDEAAALARRLREPDERRAAVTAARAAIGDRFGPLDGQASVRAAAWLMSFVDR